MADLYTRIEITHVQLKLQWSTCLVLRLSVKISRKNILIFISNHAAYRLL